MFPATVSSIEYIRDGRLRALAVTTATRSELLPDIPTVDQFVPGYEASGWFGLGAPKATPAEIVEKLNKEINAGLAIPKSRRGWPTSEARRLWARPPISASSSPTTPRSGARLCERQTSSQTDHRHSI